MKWNVTVEFNDCSYATVEIFADNIHDARYRGLHKAVVSHSKNTTRIVSCELVRKKLK
jgi:hypothetical protein